MQPGHVAGRSDPGVPSPVETDSLGRRLAAESVASRYLWGYATLVSSLPDRYRYSLSYRGPQRRFRASFLSRARTAVGEQFTQIALTKIKAREIALHRPVRAGLLSFTAVAPLRSVVGIVLEVVTPGR